MKPNGPKMPASTWKSLLLIGQKQGSIKLKDLGTEMGLGEDETLAFIRQVFPTDNGARVYSQNDEYWVDIDANAIQYMLPLSPLEWMELHSLMSGIESCSPVQNSLKRKITESGPIKVVMDLLSQLDRWEQQLTDRQQELVELLDQMILEKKAASIETLGDKTYSIFPCKVLHLEGQLSLIAEDVHDHCLSVIGLQELVQVEPLPLAHSSKVSSYEIEEFIAAIRSMNEKETRLILKIHEPHMVNLFPDHHFLGKPCMVTNPNGDLIWAAYVEPCEALYEWLLTLGTKVEILDPGHFKQEYLSYCEEKVRKIA